jgi:predicted DNA-binding transcriptional regulator AlpA
VDTRAKKKALQEKRDNASTSYARSYGMTARLEIEDENDRPIRKPECKKLVGLSDPTLNRLEAKGEFPKRFWLTPNVCAWWLSEVRGWLAERSAVRSTPANSARLRAMERARAARREKAAAAAP